MEGKERGRDERDKRKVSQCYQNQSHNLHGRKKVESRKGTLQS